MMSTWLSAVIICPTLSAPTDGRVTYSTSLPFVSETMATYFCDTGFGLSGGDVTSICGGDGSSPNGMWSGTPPVCEGTYVFVCTLRSRLCLVLYSDCVPWPFCSLQWTNFLHRSRFYILLWHNCHLYLLCWVWAKWGRN